MAPPHDSDGKAYHKKTDFQDNNRVDIFNIQ